MTWKLVIGLGLAAPFVVLMVLALFHWAREELAVWWYLQSRDDLIMWGVVLSFMAGVTFLVLEFLP